jgi:hypothetical protein
MGVNAKGLDELTGRPANMCSLSALLYRLTVRNVFWPYRRAVKKIQAEASEDR